MRVIDQDTGKSYFLDRTPELEAELDAFHQSLCKHPQVEIRQRKDGGGASHFYRQCVICGTSVGSALKKSPELINLPQWKDDHEAKYIADREAERIAIIQKHIRKQKNGDDGFKRKYDIYLASSGWQTKRAKILKRAGGICEGCLERKATQVHHVTYDHIFEEFMFELIAICDECHVRLHPEKHDLEPVDFETEWREGHPCDGCRHGSEQQNRRWCFILDQYASEALAKGGDCGPELASFEPLR
ncbi:MAG TPA: hypothetical protein VM715_07135 [Candidatus Acidoferrum sp.]|nr:hypothetical protein [Candidatus Acidoferrum sp.]